VREKLTGPIFGSKFQFCPLGKSENGGLMSAWRDSKMLGIDACNIKKSEKYKLAINRHN